MSRSAFFILFLLMSAGMFSQTPEIQFERISVRQGFSDHSINCITQDHNGFIWIGGSNGLYKYDGYEFTYFQYQPGDKRNQYFKEVYRIQEDRQGLLWILSEIGIVLFDPEKDRTVLLDIYNYEKKSDIFNYRPDILIDTEGIIWATYRKGVIKISCSPELRKYMTESKPVILDDSTLFKKEVIDLPYSYPQSFNLVTRIFEDRNHNILIGCTLDLFFLDKKHDAITRLREGPGNSAEGSFSYVRSIVQDIDNSYWIAAGNFLYNLPEKGSVTGENKRDISSPGLMKFKIKDDQVPTSLLLDHNKNLLLGTNMEIYRIIKKNKPDKVFFSLLASNEVDPEYYGYTKTIRDIFEDRSGVIWTAQDYYGITRFNQNSSQFNLYKNLIIKNFKSTDINPLYKDSKGDLWIGSYGGGLYKFQEAGYRISQYDMYRQKNNIVCLTEVTPGQFWLGTDRGLVQFDASSGRSGDPPQSALKALNQKEIYVWDLLKDDNMIYIASIEGLYLFDLKSNVLYNYPLATADSLSEIRNTVYSLLRLKNGDILAGTSLQGILKINKSGSGSLFSQIIDYKTLSGNGIKTEERHRLFEDNNGLIWIADYSGLHSLNIKGSEIKNYKLFDKINFPVAWSITEDNHDNLWIGTHFGLCCFNEISKKVRVYGRENGLPVTIHGLNSVYNDRHGRLYFGGIGGFYDFYPDSLKTNNMVPPVVITDMMLFNRSLMKDTLKGSLLKSEVPYIKAIKLRHDQNDLSFRFSALDYNRPSENRYKYKLEGYQKQWISADADHRTASYLKLKPGTYVFRVKGSNSDGIWNEEGASLKVTIRKPWWSTYFAWAVYLIIFFSLIAGFFRLRLYRLRKEREELENLVSIRTREIEEQSREISDQKNLLEKQNVKIKEEEEMKSRFFSNISHEFRTPLSLIKSPAEELLDDPHLNDRERRKLSMINRNTNRLLNLVNQLMDLSKFDSNKMMLEICEGDVMQHLSNVALSFASVAEVKSVVFQCHFDNNGIISWYDPDKLEKIATNLLSNAFKFTPAGGEIEFRAGYVKDENPDIPLLLEFLISDNGPGIPDKSLDKIFDRFYQVEETIGTDNVGTGIGLSLSRDLARLMHGDITVRNGQNSGCTFAVSIPLGKDHLKDNEYVVINNQAYDNRMVDALNAAFFEPESDAGEPDRNEKGKPVILIIDDNRDLRNQLSDSLGSAYSVTLAVDGFAGMKKALEIMPDLIITDIMMPKMDGMEICRQLKENEITSHIPIVMLTARDTLADRVAGLEIGADDYIIKPFNMSELKARIANLIDQRRKLRDRFSREITLEPADISITPADEKFINKAVSIVEKHMKDEKFDLVMFRQEMGLSRSTLSRKLAALTGQSPTEFIRTIRLKRAARLIAQNYGNIGEVAVETGFNDVSYFNRSFKKLYGISPTEYAKKEAEKNA